MSLREIHKLRQREGEPRRRWFTSESFDLIVWQDQHNTLVGFQCCYDKPWRERALEWFIDEGISHYDVDDGEQGTAGYKESPILVSDGLPPVSHIVQQFLAVSDTMEAQLRSAILQHLQSIRS